MTPALRWPTTARFPISKKGKTERGKKEFKAEHRGIKYYYFTSEAQRQKFLNNPEKYEPAFGGGVELSLAGNQVFQRAKSGDTSGVFSVVELVSRPGTGVYFVQLDTTKQTIVRQVTLQK